MKIKMSGSVCLALQGATYIFQDLLGNDMVEWSFVNLVFKEVDWSLVPLSPQGGKERVFEFNASIVTRDGKKYSEAFVRIAVANIGGVWEFVCARGCHKGRLFGTENQSYYWERCCGEWFRKPKQLTDDTFGIVS